MKSALILMLGALALTASAQDDIISYKGMGFSFTPPTVPGEKPGIMVMAFLPPTHAFSANISVMIQDFPGTIQDYDALSLKQLQQQKFILVSSQVKGTESHYEYTGKASGNDVHFYGRAIKGGEKVYLITGTVLQSEWATEGPVILKSIASFVLAKVPKNAEPAVP